MLEFAYRPNIVTWIFKNGWGGQSQTPAAAQPSEQRRCNGTQKSKVGMHLDFEVTARHVFGHIASFL